MLNYINDIKVLYGNLCSDHRPLLACFESFVSDVMCTANNAARYAGKSLNWSKASSSDVGRYQLLLAESLAKVDIPHCLLSCSGECDDLQHKHALADYYDDIIRCMKSPLMMLSS